MLKCASWSVHIGFSTQRTTLVELEDFLTKSGDYLKFILYLCPILMTCDIRP